MGDIRMRFDIRLTEVRSKVIPVEAPTEEEALAQVEARYLNGEIVLESGDFEDAHYMVEA
jgi:hypothetical protein